MKAPDELLAAVYANPQVDAPHAARWCPDETPGAVCGYIQGSMNINSVIAQMETVEGWFTRDEAELIAVARCAALEQELATLRSEQEAMHHRAVEQPNVNAALEASLLEMASSSAVRGARLLQQASPAAPRVLGALLQRLVAMLLCCAPLAACTQADGGPDGGFDGGPDGGSDGGTDAGVADGGPATWNLDSGMPEFIDRSPLAVASLDRVSRFRSGFGHDYSDGFENCRSMKHYFQPLSALDWSRLPIVAPVSGTLEKVTPERQNGLQLWLIPDAQPAFHLVLFHVNTTNQQGDHVTAGEVLGTMIDNSEDFDVALWIDTPDGNPRLGSFFAALSDDGFAPYRDAGTADRAQFIISQQERDADPIVCSAGAFVDGGTAIADWVELSDAG